MDNKIDYYKSVDTIDEGIMSLNFLKSKVKFPECLRLELIEILEFLKKAELPEYEELLYDKRIAISKENLQNIHKKIKDLNIPIDKADSAISLLKQISSDELSIEQIDQLEKYLFEFSYPLWVTTITRN
jgi:hypothetical protein